MADNKQGRKWLLTINNPLDAGLDHVRIIEIAKKFMPDYFCMADEIAPSTGTYHTHLYIYSKSPIRFQTLKSRFLIAHIDKAVGSSKENRAYILKEGKWSEDAKACSKVVGTFYEWGEIPEEKAEKEPALYSIIEDIKEGKSVAEIVQNNPKYALKTRDIEVLRQTILSDIGAGRFRNIECIYLWGESGVGKTRSIYSENPYRDIYRITTYRKNGILFDGYNSEKVLVFEEFHSSVPIAEMLNYLDIYPIFLPARYSDKVALFQRVYITSNIPIEQQYVEVQKNTPEVWNAFLRRVTRIKHITGDGKVINYTTEGVILDE